MKRRFAPSLLLAIVLFLTSTVSVDATPHQQDMEEAIVQAINATAQELGYSERARSTISTTGCVLWDFHTSLSGPWLEVRDTDSECPDQEAYSDVPGQFTFHGYPANHLTNTGLVYVFFGRYMLWVTICFCQPKRGPLDNRKGTHLAARA